MVTYSYKPQSSTVDYSVDPSEKISREEAETMALVDIAISLKRIASVAENSNQELRNISEDIAGIRQNTG